MDKITEMPISEMDDNMLQIRALSVAYRDAERRREEAERRAEQMKEEVADLEAQMKEMAEIVLRSTTMEWMLQKLNIKKLKMSINIVN